MNRTTTEIFIEVEEILAVRTKGKATNGKTDLNYYKDEQSKCPVCGQSTKKILKSKKKISETIRSNRFANPRFLFIF